jgi:hypothetical protein
MRRLLYVLLTVLVLAALALAANVNIQINRNGAARAQARAKDRIVWTGTNWIVEFRGETPCQDGKRNFNFKETGEARFCIISVPCNANDRSGCKVYKYHSQADGGPFIDPEIEVTFP